MPVSVSHKCAALFVREDSLYLDHTEIDCYPASRNALSFQGGIPVVAHPPCRSWARLAHLAKPLPGERELAMWAVDVVRREGGVLEHPSASRLWYEKRLPPPAGLPDEFGGYSIQVDQCDFGHPARKASWFYIVGVPLHKLPSWPVGRGVPTHCITSSKRPFRLPEVSRKWREQTPPALVSWLIQVATAASRA